MFKHGQIINTHNILFLVFLTIGAFFRFAFLGYSDLQGDETKVFAYRNVSNLWGFLLINSKGPGQYLVAWATESLSLNFMDVEFMYRLPFALAGFAAIYLFYFISQKFFSSKVALIVLLIAALNGFFIAFSRIVQYQSIEIFLTLASTLFFLLFIKYENWRDLILSSLFGAIGLLFHFDAISFIIPQLILISLTNSKLKNYAVYFLGLATSLIFFIPYVINETFQSTLNYIVNDRAIAEFSYDSVFYSWKLATVYFPKEYLAGVLLGITFALWNLKRGYYRAAMFGLCIVLALRFWVEHPYKPLILLSVIFIGLMFLPIFLDKKIKLIKKYFFIWFLVTFTIYILVLNKPLTHVYNVFIPLTFLVGYQLSKIKNKVFSYVVLVILLISSASFNYQAYIENKTEYPWQAEKYIFGKMYQGISEGEVVRGIFGFPYYRGLDNLRRDFNSILEGDVTPLVYTNIKLVRFGVYLPDRFSAGLREVRYYIEVKNDRDYEEDPPIIDSPKVKLLESENYSIYKIL